MSTILEQVLAANRRFVANFGDRGKLPMPPARKFGILTCMDARMDPIKFAGLADGDAHVLRNAGGRASDDAIRSIVISHKLQGTNEWFVVHHTECGQSMFTEDTIRKLLATSLETATLDATGWHDHGQGPGSVEGAYIDWLTFKNLEESVVEDVARIRHHPLVPKDLVVHGYVYDVKTGELREVPAATRAGRPRVASESA